MDRRECPKCHRKYGPDYHPVTCGSCGTKIHSAEAIASRKIKRIESRAA